MKENGFTLAKEGRRRRRRYPAQTITDADYVDDITRLENIPVKADSLLHSLRRVASGIGLHVKAEKNRIHVF